MEHFEELETKLVIHLNSFIEGGMTIENFENFLKKSIKECAQKTRQKILNDAIEVLNSALNADPEAINVLISTRIACNMKMGQEPFVQVGTDKEFQGNLLGALGLINGVLKAKDPNFVSAIIDKNGKITHFQNLREVISA